MKNFWDPDWIKNFKISDIPLKNLGNQVYCEPNKIDNGFNV